jgi:hypothetical protein
MCTVTILRAGGVTRLACNRDESRSRPEAHPPFIERAGRLLVLTPQDPQGHGTWVAANGAGLVFALLNAHPTGAAPRAGRSRGSIIPLVWDCPSLDEIVDRIGTLLAYPCPPCRLLAADEHCVLELPLGGAPAGLEVHVLDRPMLFTSSSLGDALVDGPRRMLFEQMLAPPHDSDAGAAARQDAFHAHRWRHRPAVSVHMSRPDACTVSTTVVECSADDIRMTYRPAHDLAGTPVGLAIDRERRRHAAPSRDCREHAAV